MMQIVNHCKIFTFGYIFHVEPTSALDPDSVRLVEKTLKSRTCIWITHDPKQQERVATHTLTLSSYSEVTPAQSVNGESSSNSAKTIGIDM
jgi:ABC-type phosphate transport system ATPase subunit